MDPKNAVRLAQLAQAERISVQEVRARLGSRSLDEGLLEAISLAALTVSELAHRVNGDEAALLRVIGEQGPSFSLRRRWETLHPPASRE